MYKKLKNIGAKRRKATFFQNFSRASETPNFFATPAYIYLVRFAHACVCATRSVVALRASL